MARRAALKVVAGTASGKPSTGTRQADGDALKIVRPSIAKVAAMKEQREKPYEVRADNPRGLLLRVQPSGARTFYAQVARGKRVRIGEAGTFTLAMAKVQARQILAAPEKHERKVADAMTLREYIEQEYREYAKAMLKGGEKSVARVKVAWKSLLNKRMGDISAVEVDKIRVKRRNAGAEPATVNRDVSALSGVFAHWVKNNKGSVHPLRGLEPLKVADDEVIRYLTTDEEKRLRQALAGRDAAAAKERASANKWRAERGYELLPEITGYSDHLTPMVLLSLKLGLRQGELFAMKWENIDFRAKTVSVLASHSKGNKTRTVAIGAEALAVLQAIKPDPASGLVFVSPITGEEFDNVKKAWAEITKTAKLPGLRWHDLRHSYASALVMGGVSLYTVQSLLGHSNPKMTMRYARLAPNALHDAVAVLEQRS